MSTTVTLPPSLTRRIGALARRVRRLRALRGAAVLLAVLALTAAAALVADYLLDLPQRVRLGVFSAWASLGIAALLTGVLLPLCRRLSPAALAALVEQHYPQLGERLTSSVELTDHPAEGAGSPALIALLVHDTEQSARPLDFRQAMPGEVAARWAAVATAILLAVLTPAWCWPHQAAALAQRFFVPWQIPAVAPPFTLGVGPGDAFAARGRPLTLTARLQPRDGRVVLPTAVSLIVTDAAGKEARQLMEPDGHGAFTAAHRVGGDFRYQVEAGEITSESFVITAVTPVELAAESPTITVTPPAYAAAQLDKETFHGLVDLSALQHSEVRFDFRFNRPAVAARLEWTTQEVQESKDGTEAASATATHNLTLADGGQAASFTLPAKTAGTFRLVLEAEHGITTEREGGSLIVRPDLPPAFIKVNAKEDLAAVLAYDRLPLELRLTDDVAISEAVLEYRINGGTEQVEPLKLEGANSREAVGRLVFHLAAKVKEDDEVTYRFRARDNLPKEFQGPNTVYYPADRWLRLKVARKGQPLKPQEIAGQRDEINRRLEVIRADLRKEQTGVHQTQQESKDQPDLAAEQVKQVRQLVKDNDASQKGLRDLSHFAGDIPALAGVADLADDVARKEMQETRSALDHAGRRGEKPQARDRNFKAADKNLAAALHRLDEVKRLNDRIAAERLNQARLEELADRQKQLAERAAELVAKHPAREPKTKELAEQLKREQAEVAAELQQLTQQSEALRQALDEVRAERAREAAAKARELAKAQRELAEAVQETQRRKAEGQLGEHARRQKELAEEAARLAEETRLAAGTAGAHPLAAEELERAFEQLKKGETADATRRQQRAAQELDRLANALEGSAQVSRDPRKAARQLAALEGVLKQAAEEEMRRDSDKPLEERLKPLIAEQEALRRAAERLSVPPQNAAAVEEKKAASERAAEAEKALEKPDARQAAEKMDQARAALERLADRLPPIIDRIGKARQEAARLRKEQEAIAYGVTNRRTDDASAARREADVARGLEQMDTPNQDDRKERVRAALKQAQDDLEAGRHEDAVQSQQEAVRQLHRMEKALLGQPTPDEVARDLARQQNELARQAADPRTTPQLKLDMRRKQKQVADQAAAFKTPEAPQRQREAGAATRRAAEAAQEEPTSAESQKAMREAARKLENLARQLNGGESQAQRAERLAQRQAEAAADGERQAKARPGDDPSPQDQGRQKEIAQEARQIPGGNDAQAEKGRAMAALARAEKATDASERAGAQRDAAEALQDVADKLGQRSDPATKAQEIARAQRALAKEAAEREAGKPAPEEARRAADRQADLARRMERLTPKDDARPAAQEAAERMAEAKKALEDARTPADARESLARAAEAAENVARNLGKDPSDSAPRQAAQQLAQKQRELAKATQQAQEKANREGGEAGQKALEKAMDALTRQQQDLNQQAAQLPAGEASGELEKVREAMHQARQALARQEPERARRKQEEAARQMENLARRLPAGGEVGGQAPAMPRGMPTREQYEQLRSLARRQWELRNDVLQAARGQAAKPRPAADDSVSELARRQQELAREAKDLEGQVTRREGENTPPSRQAKQAAQATEQAARDAEAGALEQAQKTGEKASGQLRELGKHLGAADRLGSQAEQLARRQEDLNRLMGEVARKTDAREAKQLARQEELLHKADELNKDLVKLMEELARSPLTLPLVREAAGASDQARQVMKLALDEMKTIPLQAQSAQEQAIQALEKVAEDAEQAGQFAGGPNPKSGEGSGPKPAGPADQAGNSPKPGAGQAQSNDPKQGNTAGQKAGQAVQQAQGQMGQAQDRLGQGQHSGAQASMEQAAQALQQAVAALGQGDAQQNGQPGQPGQPNTSGRTGTAAGGTPDLTAFGLPRGQYAGKTWGELPGELRTKIVQDMKAKYGDDYARMIKLYFEQIADTRKK
jgi:hypothetical protein